MAKKKRDIGRIETDKALSEIEKRIKKVYKQANKEIADKADDYFRRFKIKDDIKRKQLADGIITAKEYQEWQQGQVLIGQRWIDMRNQLANDYHNANVIARSVTEGYMPEIYALNHNYSTFEIEKESLIDTSYTLYNREAVENILRENPRLLPLPGKELQKRINAGKDVLWNNRQIQSVMMQGILQGESIPALAKRLESVTEKNHANAIRNARTMATTAENAGRYDAMKRAKSKGLNIQKTWVATLDSRTRHAHRLLDGVTLPLDEPFVSEFGEIMKPGDPAADPADLYNCRCTLISQIKGFETDVTTGRVVEQYDSNLQRMSYSQWKSAKAKPESITKQEEIGEAMRNYYIGQYRRKK